MLSEFLELPTHYGPLLVRHFCVPAGVRGPGKSLEGEGLVISASKEPSTPTFVRIQSSCIFGEALHSSGCDCAAQLSLALTRAVEENGLVVYCQEEGRGAGLKTKVEAMLMQQKNGIDTDEAYRALRLPPDLRNYGLASHIIKLAIGDEPRIRLMTNNPNKVEQLKKHGIIVDKIESAVVYPIHNEALSELITKRDKFGHLFPDGTLDQTTRDVKYARPVSLSRVLRT